MVRERVLVSGTCSPQQNPFRARLLASRIGRFLTALPHGCIAFPSLCYFAARISPDLECRIGFQMYSTRLASWPRSNILPPDSRFGIGGPRMEFESVLLISVIVLVPVVAITAIIIHLLKASSEYCAPDWFTDRQRLSHWASLNLEPFFRTTLRYNTPCRVSTGRRLLLHNLPDRNCSAFLFRYAHARGTGTASRGCARSSGRVHELELSVFGLMCGVYRLNRLFQVFQI